MGRTKKYRMTPISKKFSEKGGFTAQFVGDGYSVDAETEILPRIIEATGIRIGNGAAWDLISSFVKACARHTSETGETVTVGSLLTFGLSIRGWYANQDSRADRDNVRVTATLLGDLKPAIDFGMSNIQDGVKLGRHRHRDGGHAQRRDHRARVYGYVGGGRPPRRHSARRVRRPGARRPQRHHRGRQPLRRRHRDARRKDHHRHDRRLNRARAHRPDERRQVQDHVHRR